MSAPPFTPGDWIADEAHLTIRTADGKLDVAQVLDDGTCPAEQLKADVHILAASKAMYAALSGLIEECRCGGGCDGEDSTCEGCEAIKVGRLAIAQAEGRR